MAEKQAEKKDEKPHEPSSAEVVGLLRVMLGPDKFHKLLAQVRAEAKAAKQ